MQYKKSIKNRKVFKFSLSLSLMVMLTFILQATAFATESETVLTVDTSLNVESPDTENETYSQYYDYPIYEDSQWVWHPISVVNEPVNGFNAIRRTYALPPEVNPSVISTEHFVMFGQLFTFAYVLQQPTSHETHMEMRETVTIETRTRDLNDILPNLEQEILFERDGFAGMLLLDLHSISSEVAGTTRQTSTATRQRTFPHLSAPDNSLIPRTVTEGGTTFHLSTVDWQANSMAAIDGHPVATSYTANATYTAQITQTRTTGYTTTAEYIGTVFRTTQDKTLYTAIFYGEPIVEIWLDEPVTQPTVAIQPVPELQPEHTTVSAEEPISNVYNGNNSNGIIIALAVIGTLIGLSTFGIGGFLLAKHLMGYNATVYSIDGPREIVKAGKIKINANSSAPVISLNNVVGRSPAKTDRYIIQIAQRVIPKLIDKVIRVVLHDKEAIHKMPNNAIDSPVYEFEVNFSDDDSEGYPFDSDNQI